MTWLQIAGKGTTEAELRAEVDDLNAAELHRICTMLRAEGVPLVTVEGIRACLQNFFSESAEVHVASIMRRLRGEELH